MKKNHIQVYSGQTTEEQGRVEIFSHNAILHMNLKEGTNIICNNMIDFNKQHIKQNYLDTKLHTA